MAGISSPPPPLFRLLGTTHNESEGPNEVQWLTLTLGHSSPFSSPLSFFFFLVFVGFLDTNRNKDVVAVAKAKREQETQEKN